MAVTAFSDPNAFREAVRARANPELLAMLREWLGDAAAVKRVGAWYRSRCPIHNGRRPNFAVNPTTGRFICHSECGENGRGDVFDFVMRWQGVDFESALAYLAARVGVSRDGRAPLPRPAARMLTNAKAGPPPIPRVEYIPDDRATRIYRALWESLTLTERGADYLRGRGIGPADAAEYGVRSIDGPTSWSAVHTALRDRFSLEELEPAGLAARDDLLARLAWKPPMGVAALVVPYWYREQLVALKFRNMTPGCDHGARFRTLQPQGEDAIAHPPFNADVLDACADETLHVAEGELNALCLLLSGATAVGLAGARWSTGWTWRLESVRRLFVWFDEDKASGMKERALGDALKASFGSRWLAEHAARVPLPVGTDANDLYRLDRERLRERIAELER